MGSHWTQTFSRKGCCKCTVSLRVTFLQQPPPLLCHEQVLTLSYLDVPSQHHVSTAPSVFGFPSIVFGIHPFSVLPGTTLLAELQLLLHPLAFISLHTLDELSTLD